MLDAAIIVTTYAPDFSLPHNKKEKLTENLYVRSIFCLPHKLYIISELVKYVCSIPSCGQIVMAATRKLQGKKKNVLVSSSFLFRPPFLLSVFVILCRMDRMLYAG